MGVREIEHNGIGLIPVWDKGEFSGSDDLVLFRLKADMGGQMLDGNGHIGWYRCRISIIGYGFLLRYRPPGYSAKYRQKEGKRQMTNGCTFFSYN